jgi:hypothetical protein
MGFLCVHRANPTTEDALTTRYSSSVCRSAATRVLTGKFRIRMRVLSVSSADAVGAAIYFKFSCIWHTPCFCGFCPFQFWFILPSNPLYSTTYSAPMIHREQIFLFIWCFDLLTQILVNKQWCYIGVRQHFFSLVTLPYLFLKRRSKVHFYGVLEARIVFAMHIKLIVCTLQ